MNGHHLRFILDWPTRYRLSDDKGEPPAWRITRGKHSQDHRRFRDLRRHRYRKTGIVASRVRHPQMDVPLWLSVFRPGEGRASWYLLTSEPVETPDDAWPG